MYANKIFRILLNRHYVYIMSSTPPSSPKNTPPTSTPLDASFSQTIVGDGYVVQTAQYADSSGTEHTDAIFVTTDPSSDAQITEDLSGNVIAYYDDTASPATSSVLDEIKFYASEFKCAKFHGKGTIDDYAELFDAASRIANESKHMQLDVEIDGFNEFADAADQLGKLFTSFIVKLENVSIIDDMAFLTAIANALKKLWNLSSVFGKFKETILATSKIHLPKSVHDTKVMLEDVVGNVNCAMKYISHFVDASFAAPTEANLSDKEKNIIQQAVTTIDNWNVLCEQGVSIAMANNPDIQYIQSASDQFKTTTQTLTAATNQLKVKLAKFKIQ